jgi:hypothetical protein
MGIKKIRCFNKPLRLFVWLCIIFQIISCFQPRAKTDSLKLSKDIPEEYKSFFNFRDTSLFNIALSYNTKYRAPFSVIDYKTKCTIIIYKITDSITESLQRLIKVSHHFSSNNRGIIYDVVNEYGFYLAYSPDTTNKINSINLNLFGDSIQNIIQSDTIINYYLKFNQISWSKDFDKSLDIYIEPDGNFTKTTRIPSCIMFIKRHSKLYFILLSVKSDDDYLDKHLLQNLVSK